MARMVPLPHDLCLWHPDVLCDGHRADDRARWVEQHRPELDAKQHVASEFPSNFQSWFLLLSAESTCTEQLSMSLILQCGEHSNAHGLLCNPHLHCGLPAEKHTAGSRAQWLQENCGLSEGDAFLKVSGQFPEVFARKAELINRASNSSLIADALIDIPTRRTSADHVQILPPPGSSEQMLFGVNFATGLMSSCRRPLTRSAKLQYVRELARYAIFYIKLWSFDDVDLLDALGEVYGELDLLHRLHVMIHIPCQRIAACSKDRTLAEHILHVVNSYSFVQSVAVGNELDFPSGQLPEGENLEAFEMLPGAIANVKEAVGNRLLVTVPFSADLVGPRGEDWKDVIVKERNATIVRKCLPYMDVFTVNLYPIFAFTQKDDPCWQSWVLGNDVALKFGTKSMLESMLKNVRQALTDLTAEHDNIGATVPLAIGETGWPTDGEPHANVGMARKYYSNVLYDLKYGNWPAKYGLKEGCVFLFELFDEACKPGKALEKHFGLLNEDGSPKIGLSNGILPLR